MVWAGDARMSLGDGVTFTHSDGEVLVMCSRTEEVFGIDGPAAEAFVLLASGLTFAQACAHLLAEWDADAQTLSEDVRATLEGLRSQRIVRMRVGRTSDEETPIAVTPK